MADDIDIEEHDLLQQASTICLEFPAIKPEPVDYEDNYEEYSGINYETYPVKIEPMDCDIDTIHGENSSLSIAPETVQIESNIATKNLQSNRIILGNKPCPPKRPPWQRPCPKSKKIRPLFVLIEDWSERLNSNPCFCQECETLFATRNAIDAHNMAAHSFLVPVENTPPAVESRKPTTDVEVPPNYRLCAHCNTHFDDDNLLIQHMYELIQAKQKSKDPPKPKPPQKTIPPESQPSATRNNYFSKSRLLKDTCLLCQTCLCYFRAWVEFKKHCDRTHGPSKAIELPFTGVYKCKMCNSVKTNLPAHNTHMRRVHKRGIIEKGFVRRKDNTHTKPTTKKVVVSKAKPIFRKFKCAYCDLTFNNTTLAKIHQRNFHERKIIGPKTHQRGIVKKVVRQMDNALLPKNVLFKCNRCPRHLLNCITCLTHNVRCSSIPNNVRLWKCEICNRIFSAQDRRLHQLQHRHTKDFKVYVKHDHIYARVLYRCPTCEVYFDERNFLKHSSLGCDTLAKKEYCKICEVNVHSSVLHDKRHKKLIKSDFIFIDELIQTNMASVDTKNKPESSGILRKMLETKPNLKRKMDDQPVPLKIPKKKVKVTKEAIVSARIPNDTKKLYYCNICKFFLRSASKRTYHVSMLCRSHKKRGCYCPICGLPFTTAKQTFLHKQQHEKIKMKNLSFICVKTLQPCVPSLPELLKCNTCGVNFLGHHKCSKKTWSSCSICKKNFNDKAYQLHMLHHKLFAKPAPRNSIENTLKMKYSMLTPTWNILYNCESCDVTTDSYDVVVDHCQKHFNDMQSFDVTIQNCQECALTFEEKCFNKHRELHSNQNIDKNSFTILPYNYAKLLTDEWMAIFDSLPKEQMNQILRCTIYVTRQVKMSLLQSGPPEYTIYKCLTCEEVVAKQDVLLHTDTWACQKRSQTIACKICGLAFASVGARTEHVSIHNEQSVTADSLRMVAFNHPDDIDFNKTLQLKSTTKSINNVPRLSEVRKKQQKVITYFRCEKCYVCTCRLQNTENHVCPPEAQTRLCNKCNNVFPAHGLFLHKKRHSVTAMRPGEIIIKPYNVNIKDGEKRVQLTECESCQVQIPTHLWHSHQCSKKSSVEIIPTMKLYRCPTCKSVFTYKENLDKHSLTCNVKTEIAAKPQVNIFQCKQCSLCTLSYKTMSNHVYHRSGPREKCNMCRFVFSQKSLKKHIALHHMKWQLAAKDYIVKAVDCTTCPFNLEKQQPLEGNEQPNEPFKISGNDKKFIKTRKVRRYERNLKKGTSEHSLTSNDYDEDNVEETANYIENQSNDNISIQDATSDGDNSKEYPETKKKHYKTTEESEKRRMYKKLNNTVFRCPTCKICYLSFDTWIKHIKLNHKVTQVQTCEVCKLKFTYKTYIKHADVVHPAFSKGILNVETPDESLGLISTVPGRSILQDSNKSFKKLNNDSNVSQSGTDAEDSILEDTSNQSQEENTSKQPRQSLSTTSSKKYTHKIYRCGLCNVYFMAQNTCYIHMLHHTPIDPKEYIECKLCNLPFKIMSLSNHVRKHHKDSFNLDEVLVEDYTTEGKTPKIELYFASDKVQSRLVSTTSEDPDVGVNDITCNTENDDSVVYKTVNDLVDSSLADKTAEENVEPSESTDENTREKEEEIRKRTVNDLVDTSMVDKTVENNGEPLETTDGHTIDAYQNNSNNKENDKEEEKEEKNKFVGTSFVNKTDGDNDKLSEMPDEHNKDVCLDFNKKQNDKVEVNEEKSDAIIDITETKDIDDNTDKETNVSKYECQFCGERFNSNTFKEFHESLDHLDGEKSCVICEKSFNASILDALHLSIKDNTFKCCVCEERFDIKDMAEHSLLHP